MIFDRSARTSSAVSSSALLISAIALFPKPTREVLRIHTDLHRPGCQKQTCLRRSLCSRRTGPLSPTAANLLSCDTAELCQQDNCQDTAKPATADSQYKQSSKSTSSSLSKQQRRHPFLKNKLMDHEPKQRNEASLTAAAGTKQSTHPRQLPTCALHLVQSHWTKRVLSTLCMSPSMPSRQGTKTVKSAIPLTM